MDYQIERCKAEDYDELLETLNKAFGKEGERSFVYSLPVMWERDDESMSKHLAIRVDGKMVAAVGIYPLPAVVAGKKVLFATVGNIGVLPEYGGRGMMQALFTRAVDEAKKMGVDVIRLGGLRQRYNRYGFENGGVDYLFKLTQKNMSDFYKIQVKNGGQPFDEYITFRQIGMEDTELLGFVMDIYKTAEMYVDRAGERRFFKTLSAYKNKIHVAFDGEGKPIGYVCTSNDGSAISEHRAFSPQLEYQMICQWLLTSGVNELTFHTAPWECDLTMLMGKICEKWSLYDSHHFNPVSWSKLLDALLKIKAKYTLIPNGNLVVRIEGYGNVELCGQNCTDTEKEAHITLTHLDAVRFFVGSLPITSVADISALPDESRIYAQSVLPLHLWWCNQDRV